MKRVVDERGGRPQRGRNGERRSQHSESNNHTNKVSAALGTKPNEIAPLAEVTPPVEAHRTIPKIR